VALPTLLIVDDHAGFRTAARQLLGTAGYEVTGEAADVQSAWALIEELHPNVVLLDIKLPDGNGFDLAERIATLPNPPIVVLISSRSRGEYGKRLAHCPVRGFISKVELSADRLDRLILTEP
jgi:DNA-binding NarL/FixJ family response regulator